MRKNRLGKILSLVLVFALVLSTEILNVFAESAPVSGEPTQTQEPLETEPVTEGEGADPSAEPSASPLAKAAPAPAAAATVDFDIISHVYDYHDSAIAVVLNMDRTVQTANLEKDTFEIRAKMTDTMHDDNKVFYDGLRTITGIYANDSGKVGDKGTEGKYIVIELKHGANVDEAVICPYRATEYFQSTLLDLEYTVTQKKDIGTVLPISEGVTYTQGELKTDTVDEFAYGTQGGVSYRFFTPEKKAGEKYPLVIWLHGFGERGTDNETHLRSNRGGVAWAEDEVQKENPCYVMSAQASAGSAWSGAGMVDDLLAAIHKEIAAHSDIDQDRIYICGVSMGGYGTWAALVQEPDLFAAAMPMAPAYTVTGEDGKITDEYKEKLDQLKDKPIYIIHGDGDPTVDIDKTSNPTFEYLTETVGNPNVIYTKIKDISFEDRGTDTGLTLHNVEVRTFNHDIRFETNARGDVALPADKADSSITPFSWMFAQSKSAAAGPEMDFDIISHVYDYHDSAIAVVLNMDRTVQTANLEKDTFEIRAKMTDTMHDDNKVFYDGLRTITGIYANDSGKVGDKGTEGKYIVIELKHGANVDEAVICPYRATEYFQSTLLDLEYTVTQKKDIGTDLTMDEKASFKQGELKTDTVDEFAYGTYKKDSAEGISYRLFTPEKESGKKYPLVIWLHGFGERGTDNETILRSNRGGVAWAEDEVQKSNPSYVMAAQAGSSKAWSGEGMIDDLLGAIKKIMAENPDIDPNRIYISGVSSGGGGTWQAILQEPGLFAAAMPLAGAYTVVDEDGNMTADAMAKLDQLKDLPIYIIHGVGDPSVDIDKTSNPIFQYLTETVGNENVIYSRMHDVSYDGRDHYTMHNVEVRVFNHDLVFVNSYDPVTNPKGDEALPADQANRNINPFSWMFAQTKEVIPAPESITLSETELELKVGETAQITATVLPENAEQLVIWSSSDENLATVEDGKITALKEGDVVITAATADGRLKAECKVKITAEGSGTGTGDNPKTGEDSHLVLWIVCAASLAAAAAGLYIWIRRNHAK